MNCPSFLLDIPGAFVLIIVSDDATPLAELMCSRQWHTGAMAWGVPSADFCNLHYRRLMIYYTVVKVQKGVRENNRNGTGRTVVKPLRDLSTRRLIE